MREDGVKPMSTLDRQEAIPLEAHGTKEGYDLGCRGSHCVGRDRLGQSCEAAKIRYARDMSYRRRVDAGMSAEAIAAEDALDEQHQVTKIVPQKDVHAAATTSFSDSEEPLRDLVEDEAGEQLGDPGVGPDDQVDDVVADGELEVSASSSGIPESGDSIPLEKHGTVKGYWAGCRRDDCPGVDTTGKTCRTAIAEYSRDRAAQKKRDAVSPPDVQPEASAEAMPELAPYDTSRDFDEEPPAAEPAPSGRSVLDDAAEARAHLVMAEGDRDAARTALVAEERANTALQAEIDGQRAELVAAHAEIAELQKKLAFAEESLIQKGLELDVAKSADVAVLRPRPVAVPASEPRLAGAGLDIRTEDGGVSVRLQGGEPLHLELNFTDGALSGAAVHVGA